MPRPPWLRCCCPGVSGHTHCLLVPARLAGVLEAGKLAVLAGPAVLVNDALLGGEEGAASSVTGRPADPCALEGPSPTLSQSQPAGMASRPVGPSPTQHTHAAALQGSVPGAHSRVCVQPSPSHTRSGSTETLGHSSRQSRWI